MTGDRNATGTIPGYEEPGPVTGRTVAESTPWWPAHRQREERPNVVMIVLDDVGFAQLGCYGSSIDTPHIDALAGGGIRYTNFHATALCSPTRASLLTGRNHHTVGMGFLAAFDTGFSSYRGCVTEAAASFAEILRDTGYGTYALGKWHLIPPGHMTSAGPFQHWPTQRGFDRYYGFLGGEDDQFRPELWADQHRVDPPADPDYHLSEDLVTTAGHFMGDHRSARPEDPFLVYLSFGACHAPHQAPADFIDRYRGRFDHGWDQERKEVLQRQKEFGLVPEDTRLAPRNPGVRAWSDLSEEERSLFARMQEVYAGFLTHTDAQIGRLVQMLSEQGELDNTLIMLMSDNGASAEGGEHGTANEYRWFLGLPDPLDDVVAAQQELGSRSSHGHYPTGWAQAGNTPGKFYKRFAHGGGVRVPLIMHWPKRVDNATPLRHQFHHVIDIAPTLLEAAGATAPENYRGVDQLPVHGTSMQYTFDQPQLPTTHLEQYFETAGYRAMYADGWKAVARHQPGTDFADDHWELYHLPTDFSECDDRSGREPERQAAMERLWWEHAERFEVLPLDDRMQARMGANDPAWDRLHYELRPGARLMNGLVGPAFAQRDFSVIAELEPWSPGDEGALMAWGHRATGWSLVVDQGHLVFTLNLGGRHTVVRSTHHVPYGVTRLGLRIGGSDGDTTATLVADEAVIGNGVLPGLIPAGMGLLPTQCGFNGPSAVSDSHAAPFTFRGRLHRVLVDLAARNETGRTAEWVAALREQ